MPVMFGCLDDLPGHAHDDEVGGGVEEDLILEFHFTDLACLREKVVAMRLAKKRRLQTARVRTGRSSNDFHDFIALDQRSNPLVEQGQDVLRCRSEELNPLDANRAP